MTTDIFIDIEWEHAENSTGAPLSIGVVASDHRDEIYGRWPLRRNKCSAWSKLQVIPQLEKDAPPASTAMDTLISWSTSSDVTTENPTVLWASESAVQEWLREAYGVESIVWPGQRIVSEKEETARWWAQMEWLDKHPRYHALWDARGLLYQSQKINQVSAVKKKVTC